MKNLTLATLCLLFCSHAFGSDLTGMKVRYSYSNGNVYDVSFKNDTDLTWQAIAGEETGAIGNEKYNLKVIENRIYLIGWVEKSGFTVSQVLNLKKMEINSHLIFTKEAGALPEINLAAGTVKIIN